MEKLSRKDQKDATAAKMTATARELFQQRGYSNVTIRDVAKAAGMSTGAVFSTFTDKDDMFLKSMGRAAPNQSRITSFLIGVQSTPTDRDFLSTHRYAAKELLADLYGEQPE